MLLVVLALATVAVVAVAVLAVLREARRLAESPTPAVYDPDDALDWVVRHIDAGVAATLSVEDLRQLLDLQVQYFRLKAASGNGSSAQTPGAVIFGGAETVDYILERAAAIGSVFTAEQVHAVVETHLTYLKVIGAVGPPAAGPTEG